MPAYIRPPINTSGAGNLWAAKDTFDCTQANTIQSQIGDSPSLANATGSNWNAWTSNNVHAGYNTFAKTTFGSGTVFFNGPTIVGNTAQLVLNSSISTLTALRAIASPVDGQIALLANSDTTYFPIGTFVYRYDASDTLSQDAYLYGITSGKQQFWCVKPTGISNTMPGCWKLLNNAGIAKGPFWLTLTSSASSASLGTGAISVLALPQISSWSSSAPNASFPMGALGFTANATLTTDAATALANGYALIPKAENYYDIQVDFSAWYAWGTAFTAFYTGQATLYGALTAVNTGWAPGTSMYFPGESTSGMVTTNPNWDTIMECSTTASNYNGTMYHQKRISERFNIPASHTQADQIVFALSCASLSSSMWANIIASAGNAPVLSFQIVAY